MPTRFAIVPARGNSKAIPKKNLRSLAGKPLLAYTVEAALATGLFEEVIVSSESDEVLAAADGLSAVPSRRPEHLSEDDVHSVHVVLDVLRSRRIRGATVVSMLLPTSPLRTADDISSAVRTFESTEADSLVSVYRDPKHLMQLRRIGAQGFLEPLFPGNPNVQRQELDEHYVVNGSIYVSTAATLLRHGSFHLGRVVPFLMDRLRSVDINSWEDIDEAQRMLSA